MGMLLDELKQIKEQINGQSWNTISTNDYREMKERLFAYIENYQEDELLKTAKEVKSKLEILCIGCGNIFTGQNVERTNNVQHNVFNELKRLLENIK